MLEPTEINMSAPKRGRRTLDETNGDRRVLMTFQVDVSLRDAAMEKANETSINLSQFLRQCVQQFVQSVEIQKAISRIQHEVVTDALEAAVNR